MVSARLSFCLLLLCMDTAQLGRCVCLRGLVELYVGVQQGRLGLQQTAPPEYGS